MKYRPETGCAAQAILRREPLIATAPPAERWLLIESRTPWPRQALTALHGGSRSQTPMASRTPLPGRAVAALSERSTGHVVSRRCAELGIRPVLIRRSGRVDPARRRRWGLVDCRPGRESVRWGDLPSDEHLLDVLDGKDPGTHSAEPVYLVCTHGRHDACCAVWGRPVAAALAAVYPERTWECSHIGGDRFAANVVLLPHSLFYGQVPPARAVELATQYDRSVVVPDLLRGSGAFVPPVQAAQHFARTAGHSLALGNLLPRRIEQLSVNRWRILLASTNGPLAVEVSAHLDTVEARLTCAGSSPAQVRRFELDQLSPDPLRGP
ncbi:MULTISPECIES: sucrase ferredoxin [Kribbella]|uniref:Sucrase ferredoxin n=1 Tax=Kribbella karoonensis TaxID=324851 RepID=A0ABN2DCG5_9ACTN